MITLTVMLSNAATAVVQAARETVVVAADIQPQPLAEIFRDGGFMMWPITLCGIAVVALAGRATWRMRAGSTEPMSALRAGIDSVLFWGVYASVLGVLGTVVGVLLAAQAVEAVGEVHVALVSGGIKVALTTTIYGMLILLGGALLWFGLRQWHQREALTEV